MQLWHDMAKHFAGSLMQLLLPLLMLMMLKLR